MTEQIKVKWTESPKTTYTTKDGTTLQVTFLGDAVMMDTESIMINHVEYRCRLDLTRINGEWGWAREGQYSDKRSKYRSVYLRRKDAVRYSDEHPSHSALEKLYALVERELIPWLAGQNALATEGIRAEAQRTIHNLQNKIEDKRKEIAGFEAQIEAACKLLG